MSENMDLDSFASRNVEEKDFEVSWNKLLVCAETIVAELIKNLEEFHSERDKSVFTIFNLKSIFQCGICWSTLQKPVTLLNGKTVCQECHLKTKSQRIGRRGSYSEAVHYGEKMNTTINDVIKELLPLDYEAGRLRQEGNKAFREKNIPGAYAYYDQALNLTKTDIAAYLNRSIALLTLSNPFMALRDAEMAFQLGFLESATFFDSATPTTSLPSLSHSYSLFAKCCYRRGAALKALNRHYEALVYYSIGIILEERTAKDDSSVGVKNNDGNCQFTFDSKNKLHHSAREIIEILLMTESDGNFDGFIKKIQLGNLFDVPDFVKSLRELYDDIISRSTTTTTPPSPPTIGEPVDNNDMWNMTGSFEPTKKVDQATITSRRRRSFSQSATAVIQAASRSSSLLSLSNFKLHLEKKLAIVRERLDCPLCYEMLYLASTLPCGHTLCRSCVARSLDQAFDNEPACPFCRYNLQPYLRYLNIRAMVDNANDTFIHYSKKVITNSCIETFITQYYTEDYTNRVKQASIDESAAPSKSSLFEGDEGVNETENIAIFICSCVLPGNHMKLRIFEPRYRLMIRRCIDNGQKAFGMVQDGSKEFGTLCHMISFQQMPDGMSNIEVKGGRPFRIKEWGSKDGYSTAEVEFFSFLPNLTDYYPGSSHKDVTSDPTLQEKLAKYEASTARLLFLKQAANELTATSPSSVIQKILNVNLPVPEQDIPFVNWCIQAMLPAHDHYNLMFGDDMRSDVHLRIEYVGKFWEENFPLLKEAMQKMTGLLGSLN